MCQCQVPMNTLKQVPKLGLDLCQRTDQTLHALGLTVVGPLGSSCTQVSLNRALRAYQELLMCCCSYVSMIL